MTRDKYMLRMVASAGLGVAALMFATAWGVSYLHVIKWQAGEFPDPPKYTDHFAPMTHFTLGVEKGTLWLAVNQFRCDGQPYIPDIRRSWSISQKYGYNVMMWTDSAGTEHRHYGSALPIWIPFVGSLIAARLLWRPSLRRRYRRLRGQCEECGYDSRGNTTNRCPECGFEAIRRQRRTATRNPD